MAFFRPTNQQVQLSSRILIIPVVSTANVSQLAADLLIASLSLQRLGVFEPDYFIPVVAGREDNAPGITTPLELHGSPSSDFLVLQQRSPVLKARKQQFVDALINFISNYAFSAVLILSGLEATDRSDDQMFVPTYYIRPNVSSTLENTPLLRLESLPIYRSPVPQQLGGKEGPFIPFIPGGGLTRRILSSLPEGWSIPTIALVHYTLEGDNRADAHLLAAVTSKVLGIDQVSWTQPGSWGHGLFGAPPNQNLYG
ncbi:hypothetical protein AX16_005216 [Volvariella volvacea WC 439]|nr:hypothetical protein AX16_005216 [Volvariella volvacea WC 439]